MTFTEEELNATKERLTYFISTCGITNEEELHLSTLKLIPPKIIRHQAIQLHDHIEKAIQQHLEEGST